MANNAPRVVGQFHTHQNVTGNTHAADGLLHGVLELNHGLHGNLNLEDLIFSFQVLDTGLDTGLHLVLVTGVGVNHIPVAHLTAQLGLEFFQSVDFLSRLSSCFSHLDSLGSFLSLLLNSCRLLSSLSSGYLDLFNLGYQFLLGHVAPTFYR